MTPNPLCWTPALKKMYSRAPYDPEQPGGFNVLMPAVCAVVRRVAREEGAELIDVEAAFFAEAKKSGGEIDKLLLDGMHPNDAGHRLIADLCASASSSWRSGMGSPSSGFLDPEARAGAAARTRRLTPANRPFTPFTVQLPMKTLAQLLLGVVQSVINTVSTLLGGLLVSPGQQQRKEFSVDVVRPDDLLVATLDFYNLVKVTPRRWSHAAGAERRAGRCIHRSPHAAAELRRAGVL